MFRYVLAYTLINILYPSFGHPVLESTPTPIGNKLLDLAQACKNTDIAELIKSQSHRCNDTAALIKDLEKCLLFFDINTQLCGIDFPDNNVDLKEKYSLKMNQFQNVQTVCKQALTWNFSTIEEYPLYNPGKVFTDEVICVKVCGVEDLLSVDTNFFCKYFMWGSEVLQNLTQQAPVTNNDAVITTSKNDKTSESDIDTETSKVNPTVVLTNNITHIEVSGKSTSTQQVVNPQEVPAKPNSSTPVQIAIKNPTESKTHVKPGTQDNSHDVKPISNEDPNSEIDQEEEEYDTPDTGDKPIVNPDPNLDPDTTFDQIPPLNNQLLGNNAPLIDTNGEFKSSINSDQKGDIFPNLRQESPDTYSDDDDNFFPFFLTGIVIVILLYVLYHNKNKVTKIILGLLVEGRQPGKRRNSRGHAYRRLDTLEQAMNSNTAAPPSKIIY